MAEIFTGTGRRKRAIAQVRLQKGSGNVKVNDRDLEEYCYTERLSSIAVAPLNCIQRLGEFDVEVKVYGGGPSGQAGAISLGIARALQEFDAELRKPLKKAGHMRRDPREKERKKSGQPGARKRFQFSKR